MYHYYVSDFFNKGESVVMTESVFVPNSLMEHDHDYLEIAYINEGVGEHILNGRHYTVKKGDVFFIARHNQHNYTAISPNFTWINCLFLPSAISSDAFCENARDIVRLAAFAHISELQTITAENIELHPDKDEFGFLFKDMLREYNEGKSGSQEVLRHYLSVLCIKLFRRYASQSQELPKSDGLDYGQMVVDLLEKSSFEHLNIDEIAQKAFLSPRYFQSVFKKHTGRSLTKFLHEMRIEKAKQLLETSDIPVNAVMLSIGYNDTKFFYTVFKRYTGMTPGEYRSRFGKKPTMKPENAPENF